MKIRLITLVFILVIGCKKAKVETRHEIKTDLPEAVDKMEKAMAAIDVTGVKGLLKENAELKAKFDNLYASLAGYSQGNASVVLKGSEVILDINQYRGDLWLNAWIDTPDNWIIKNQPLNHSNDVLKIDFEKIFDSEWNNLSNKIKKELNKGVVRVNGLQNDVKNRYFGERRKSIARNINDTVQTHFRKYLEQPGTFPAEDIDKVYLKQQFLTEGEHFIYVAIKPMSNFQQWTFRGNLAVENIIRNNINNSVLKRFSIDPHVTPFDENHGYYERMLVKVVSE